MNVWRVVDPTSRSDESCVLADRVVDYYRQSFAQSIGHPCHGTAGSDQQVEIEDVTGLSVSAMSEH